MVEMTEYILKNCVPLQALTDLNQVPDDLMFYTQEELIQSQFTGAHLVCVAYRAKCYMLVFEFVTAYLIVLRHISES